MMRAKPLLVAAQLITGVLVLAGRASANEDDGHEAMALRLFKEARLDMGNGRYDEACPKFADSEALDPGAGTMLNLAYCYEKLGKSAQAWAEYQAAAVAAHEDGKPEWEDAARARSAQLEATIGWIVIHVEKPADASRLDIRLDGAPVDLGKLERPTPVDPGRHDLKVSAMGKHSWSTTLEVDAQHTPTVDVPTLDAMPAAAPPVSDRTRIPGADAGPAPRWSIQRIAAVSMGCVGVGALGVATGFALSARSTYDGADCQGRLCTQQGADARTRAYSQAAVATVATVAGVASLASTAILWWTSPSRTASRTAGVHVEPAAPQAAWGLSVEGAW